MLQKIIDFSIKNKLIVGLFVLALAGMGVYALNKLPIDAVPDITNNQVQVITSVPSLGAADVERLITFPIEQVNANIPSLKEIRSFSRFGLSLVTIVFDDETDVYWARQQVNERLQQINGELPQGINAPFLAPVTTGLGEIYQYVLRPDKGYENKYNATELRTIQDWIVRRQLLGVKGVADVSSFGGLLKQYEIAVNSEKLNAMQVSIADVFTALEKNNQNTGGAYIEKGPTIQFIRSEGLVKNLEDIKNIVVKNNSAGMPITINDVATVQFGKAIRYGAVCYNSDGEVAGGVVMMLKGGNSSAVIKDVKSKIAQIVKTLPKGIVLEPFLDRTKMVNNAISTVKKNLLEGALIVIFVLVLFLGNLRAGLITASVIPLSMLFAIIMMNLFHVSGNLMSLGAIDFGLIVDGAVIIVEAVMYSLYHSGKYLNGVSLKSHEIDKEVSASSGRLMAASIFGQIIILIVYLPIYSLQGIEGKMFKPMAQTVTFALLGAFILSLTYVPMITSLVLSKKIKQSNNISERMMHWIETHFKAHLQKLMHYPKTMISASLALFVISIVILSFMGGEFIPELEEGDFAVDTRVLTGSNLNTTIEKTQLAAKTLLKHFPEVEKVVTKIGSGEIPTDPMPIEASDMMVILKPKHDWTSAKTFPELSDKMSKRLQDVPGITAGFQFPVQMRFNELMTGARQDVVCKIFGEDLDTLSAYADKLGRIINTVQGTQNLFIEPIEGMPQIVIQYNRPLIAQYGLNIEDINKTVNTAFAGTSAGQVFEGEKRFDLVVRLQNESRKDIRDISNLLINTPNGVQIPLNLVANVNLLNSVNQIQREDAKRRIVVGFNVSGRDVQSIVQELTKKVDKQIKLPSGYYVTYGGTFENLQQAKNRLSIAVPIALILIFLLLFFALQSVKQSLLVYSAIPLSAIGGVILLAMRGMPFSISAGIGFIALFGVAVLNGIVLISEFNRLKKLNYDSMIDLVINGTTSRLRPVLMTACVASLGFIPMALSNGAGAEVQRPLATVVIGGLISATFLTLFVLPILYVWVNKSKAKLNGNKLATMLIFMFGVCYSADAQKNISLNDAIELSAQKLGILQVQQLNTKYYEQLKRSSKDWRPSGINTELGQFNSIKFDTRLSITQAIQLPQVARDVKNVYEQKRIQSELLSIQSKLEQETRLRELFYSYLLLEQKEKLMQWADSIYKPVFQKAELRFQKGETAILESASSESQLYQIQIKLSEIEKLKQQTLIQFNEMLGETNILYLPQSSSIKHASNADYVLPEQGINYQLAQQQNMVYQAELKQERNRALPEINLGLNNQSLIGWQRVQNTDMYFNAAKRFTSISLGINIPVFRKAINEKAKANEILIEQNRLSQQYTKAKQSAQLQFWLEELNTSRKHLQTYENKLLPNAETIFKVAKVQLQLGEIDYFKWALLVQQSLNIQNEYLDVIQNYNNALIQLHYLNQ